MMILDAVNYISPCFTILRNSSQIGETIYDTNPDRAGDARSALRWYVITEAAIAALDISSTAYWLAGMAILPFKCAELGLRFVQLGLTVYLNINEPDARRKQQTFLNVLNIARLLMAIAIVTLFAPEIAFLAPTVLTSLAIVDVSTRTYLWLST